MKHVFWLIFSLLIVCVAPSANALSPSDAVATSEKTPSSSTELQQLVNQALQAFEQTPRERWAHKVVRYENEEGEITSSIEHFTPDADPAKQWSLLQLNGEPPTEKQIQSFLQNKVKRQENQEGGLQLSIRELIQLDSLSFSSETPDVVTVKFDVHLARLGEQASQQLSGTLLFNKQLQFIEQIDIVNVAPFSPMFSAKITDFKLTFSFVKIAGAILPQQQALNMKGSFAFFTEIDEVSTDTYSDYRYMAEDVAITAMREE